MENKEKITGQNEIKNKQNQKRAEIFDVLAIFDCQPVPKSIFGGETRN